MKKTIYTFIMSSCLTMAATLTAYAQAGALDPTFAGGWVTTAIGSSSDKGYSVAIQTDGKIVVAGYSTIGTNSDFSLVRYNANGTLDITFDSDGKVTTDFGGTYEYGYSVAIDTNDKIVVAGFIYNGSDPDFAVVRYNTDGSLDATFGSGGKVTTALGSATKDYGEAVAIQSDGKIVVAGYSDDGISFPVNNNFAVVRYNSNGSLDNTFGFGGIETTDFGGFDLAYAVAIQSNGKIVVAGKSGIYPINNYNFASLRYNSNGTLDNTYGNGGKDTTDFSYGDVARSVLIQPDGKIVLAGYDAVATNFLVMRYDSTGSLDNTFGTGGIVTTELGSNLDYGNAAALQSDGKIVVAGITNPISLDFALVRYNSNGTLDNTFDSDGIVTTDEGGNEEGVCIAIQNDGKIVVAGNSSVGGTDFAIARYIGDSPVGIAENNADGNTIAVFPNPFSNSFLIKGTAEKGEVTILDLMGKEIMWQKTFDAETKINTEYLPSGFYLLNYTHGNKTSNAKIVKL